jgi:hypothetical protein
VFAPHLFSGSVRSQLGCGASALALITGVPPEIIASQNGGAHYSDRFVARFLQTHRYRAFRITPDIMSRASSSIGPAHVLLISQLFRRGEGTWGVVFGDFYYHNFDAYALSALSFLNKPILSAYLVAHRKWRIKRPAEQPEHSVPPKAPRLSIVSLRKHCTFTHQRTWA